MRVYEEKELKEIYCNKCGRKIKVENQVIKDDVLFIDKKWGYFSAKDGMKHSFELCEECYDKIIEDFKYPVTETEYSELI